MLDSEALLAFRMLLNLMARTQYSLKDSGAPEKLSATVAAMTSQTTEQERGKVPCHR